MEAKKGFRAVSKNLPMSPSKIRPIADHVRLKPYADAIAILDSLPNKGAGFLKKVISSAAANAMYQDQNLDEDSLFVAELLVDGGPSRKTIWPRSRGRADRQIKRSSHISVVLDQKAVN
jgi:large subunit ribosomal protein L22